MTAAQDTDTPDGPVGRDAFPPDAQLPGSDVESPQVADQQGGWVGRETAGPAPADDRDHVAGTGAAKAGGPGDREFHLARVVAGFPRRLSARRLALLAEIVADDPP